MADLDSVVNEVLEGKVDGESPVDLIYLVTAMANGILAHEYDESVDSKYPVGKYTALIQRSGEILCPIFRPVKHPEYINQMTEVRLSLAGISRDLELQQRYVASVHMMAQERMLRDIDTAVEYGVWQNLPSRARP